MKDKNKALESEQATSAFESLEREFMRVLREMRSNESLPLETRLTHITDLSDCLVRLRSGQWGSHGGNRTNLAEFYPPYGIIHGTRGGARKIHNCPLTQEQSRELSRIQIAARDGQLDPLLREGIRKAIMSKFAIHNWLPNTDLIELGFLASELGYNQNSIVAFIEGLEASMNMHLVLYSGITANPQYSSLYQNQSGLLEIIRQNAGKDLLVSPLPSPAGTTPQRNEVSLGELLYHSNTRSYPVLTVLRTVEQCVTALLVEKIGRVALQAEITHKASDHAYDTEAHKRREALVQTASRLVLNDVHDYELLNFAADDLNNACQNSYRNYSDGVRNLIQICELYQVTPQEFGDFMAEVTKEKISDNRLCFDDFGDTCW